jgi:alpha/beta superfamily hydrolase
MLKFSPAIFTSFLVLSIVNCQADTRYVYESDFSSVLEQRVTHGEVAWLSANNEPFLSIYIEQHSIQRGVAIIIHSMGAHADWPEVVNPLRTTLPAVGWSTLSIQMPVLAPGTALSEYGATVTDAGQRIRAAITYLQGKQYENIVIIGYSFGAVTATEYMAQNPNHQVSAFVGISMQAQDFLSPRLKLLKSLEALQIPVLDYYGSRDFDEVLRSVDDRRLAGRKNGRYLYHQMSLEGADHYYSGLEEILSRRIRGWLDKVVPEATLNNN